MAGWRGWKRRGAKDSEHQSQQHELRLALGGLDEFAQQVTDGLEEADWHKRREIIPRLRFRSSAEASQSDARRHAVQRWSPSDRTVQCRSLVRLR